MDARREAGRAGDREQVLDVLRTVRNRWRMRVAFRGAAIVLGAGMTAFLLSAYALDALRFAPAAVLALRLLAWLVVGALAWLQLVRPLRRRLDDEQVALYLEEHEPSLEATLLAAVESARGGGHYSPALVQGLVRTAVERAHAVGDGRRIEQEGLYRSGGVLAALAVASVVLLLLLPSGVRHGLSALLRPTAGAAEVNPYSIAVTPGDVIVARGSDQLVTATLAGFGSSDAGLFVREGEGEAFRRITMLPGGEEGAFELLLLNLAEGADYFVEAEGTRSPTFRIDVADLPYVDRLEQELRFPDFTGLPDRVVEDGGDVAAVAGTVVALRVLPTLPTASGRLLVDGAEPVALVPGADGSLTADFTVAADGFYRIELAAADGRMIEASPRYTIDALEDQPPEVRITKPGRDGDASPLEEVYFEAEALDDFGVSELSLVYSVNGDPPRSVRLFTAGGAPLAEASAGHTVYLEELELEAGDLVTYWATARDRNGSGAGAEVTSDLYFLKIRPFGNEYRQADAPPGGGGGGMGGQGAPETALSELQKQVVAATFNLNRDRDRHSPADFSENVVSVRLAQARVREQVETLRERMVNRGLSAAEDEFRNIAEMLPIAVAEMESAEAELDAGDVQEALPHEQRALQHLQKAEETYERYVTLQQQGGGGGGGGQANADDLADLFELELDKLRNQYETVQRGEREQQSDQVDEVLERLKELSRRQQQAAERRRLEAQGGARGGDEQRALAEQTEEIARQLETLARETRDQQLAETARDLQEVADQMRGSAARTGSAGAAGAAAAADRLEEAQRRLERERQQRLQEDAAGALERVQGLVDEQARVRQEVRELAGQEARERQEQVRRLHERKDRMFGETEALREQLQRMAAEATREGDRDAAGAFSGAADEIEERKIREKIAYSKGVVEQRSQESYAATFEAEISMDLDELERQVAEATEALDERGPEPMEQALDRARDLVRGAETLERRLQQGRQGQPDAQGQEGEPGDRDGPRGAGAPGEEPGEGPQGQSGQAGQSGAERGEPGRPGGGPPPGQAGGGGQGRGDDRLDPAAQGGGGGGAANEPQRAGGRNGATRGDPRARALTPEEIRAFRNEFGERLGEARELRRYLDEAGVEPGELEGVVEALEDLSSARPYGNLPELEELQGRLRENLQRLEFRLRREVEGDGSERAVLGGSDEVPEGFRSLVEEYFRALSRGRPGG